MQAKLTKRPVERVIAAIQALDLESVKVRVTDPELGEGWTREYADSIEVAYKNYLTMLTKYQDDAEDILLSKDVDEFWHTHILQTMKYTDDCEMVFGRYLHHSPHIGEVTAEDHEKRAALAEKTRSLYEREFGSTQNYNTAWSGDVIRVEDAALSGASVRAKDAALSGARIGAEGAALSGARIGAEGAALSGARIGVEGAALSGARIGAEGAALSGARIGAEGAALSGARVRTGSGDSARSSLVASA